MPSPTLHTGRLQLCPLTLADAEDLYDAMRDSVAMR